MVAMLPQNIWKNCTVRTFFGKIWKEFGKITRSAEQIQNIFGLRVKLLQNKFKICVMGSMVLEPAPWYWSQLHGIGASSMVLEPAPPLYWSQLHGIGASSMALEPAPWYWSQLLHGIGASSSMVLEPAPPWYWSQLHGIGASSMVLEPAPWYW